LFYFLLQQEETHKTQTLELSHNNTEPTTVASPLVAPVFTVHKRRNKNDSTHTAGLLYHKLADRIGQWHKNYIREAPGLNLTRGTSHPEISRRSFQVNKRKVYTNTWNRFFFNPFQLPTHSFISIPPTPSHNAYQCIHLHAALARRRNWQSLGYFNKQCSFENRGALKYIRLIQSDSCFAGVTAADISYVFVIKRVNTALTCFRFRTCTDIWPLELRISGKDHVKDVE
jgi:hypothetical protein